MNSYDLNVRLVARTPRRRASTAETYTAAATGFTSSSTAEVATGHTHENLGLLNKFAADADNYVYLVQPREVAEGDATTVVIERAKIRAGYADSAAEAALAAQATEAEHATAADTAKQAERAKVAEDLAHDSPANERFLRKDKPDTAKERIAFEDGVHFGSTPLYHIDREGKAHLRSLAVDEYLEVPELRYNRTQVTIGYELQSPAAGVIDRVERLSELSGKVYLKLEEGELGTIEVGDLLTGIFHATAEQGGATADTDDGKLNLTFAGFATAYFKVEAVDASRKWFTYSLRPDTTFHPQRFMTFASRGNATNKERQSFAIYTRTYTRYLRGVSDWEIRATHVAMQQGDLDNLALLGFNGLSGVGVYADNIFLNGKLEVNGNYIPFEEALKGVEGKIEDNRVFFEYSTDGVTNWHTPYTDGDRYMRQKTGEGSEWGEAICFVGKDAEQFEIETLEGSTFYRVGQGFVGKFRAAYKVGGQDVTDTLHPSRIKWTRESQGDDDEHWNQMHANVFNPITITTDDIVGQTTIIATLYEPNGLTNQTTSLEL